MIEFDKTYDSHVHFFGVGLKAVEWVIEKNNLIVPEHLLDQKTIKGFGLSPNTTEGELISLSEKHSNKDFCISYSDGHSSLVSKSLVAELGFTPLAHKEHKNFVSLYEKERDEFLKLLPKKSFTDLEKMAKCSFQYFKNAGVKKVRHMTCTKEQWQVLTKIYSSSSAPELEIECLFAEFMQQTFDEAFDAYTFAKNNPIKSVTAQGLKLFVDGSIGQKTAYMSCFKDVKPRISEKNLFNYMNKILIEEDTELALHTIGDMALEMAIKHYKELSNTCPSIKKLHLEHAPIFTDKTLDILKETKLNCAFHFQPSHWISDGLWYKKNYNELVPHEIYPFEKLKEFGYRFYMGSDAPIEDSVTELTTKGLHEIDQSRSLV